MLQRTTLLLIAALFAPQAPAQVIVAHRGASYDAPENTLAAFHEAFKQRADGIEGDFYLTRDRHIVCIHDKDTSRTGGKKLDVSNSTLAELRQLEYGAWKSKKFRGETLPKFDEVAATVPAGKLFVIELKVGPEIVAPLKSEIDRLGLPPKDLLIIAFEERTVSECKKLLPDVRVHWLTGFKQTEQGSWTPTREMISATLRATGADGVGMKGERAVVDAAFIAALRAAGMQEFHVWTIDDPQDASYFQELGAIGITTNRPAFIRAALDKSANRS